MGSSREIESTYPDPFDRIFDFQTGAARMFRPLLQNVGSCPKTELRKAFGDHSPSAAIVDCQFERTCARNRQRHGLAVIDDGCLFNVESLFAFAVHIEELQQAGLNQWIEIDGDHLARITVTQATNPSPSSRFLAGKRRRLCAGDLVHRSLTRGRGSFSRVGDRG